MKKTLAITLAVASIVIVIEVGKRTIPTRGAAIVADGSDPMPLCRQKSPNCIP